MKDHGAVGAIRSVFFAKCYSASRRQLAFTCLVLLGVNFMQPPSAEAAQRWVCKTGGVKYLGDQVPVNVCYWEYYDTPGGGGGSGGGRPPGGGGGDLAIGNPGTPAQPTKDAQAKPDCAGNPIIRSTGNKVEPELDFQSEGEMGLYLRRTYNHYWSARGLFGNHWLSNFDYTIAPSADNAVLWAQRPDGRRIKFNYNDAVNRWTEDKAAAVAYIAKQSDGSYILHNEDGGTEEYNYAGYITKLRNAHNVGWSFLYMGKSLLRVTHTASGRSVNFTWQDGQLVQVTAPSGAVFKYTYTPNVFGLARHRLASTTLPGSPETTVSYHYEDSRFPGALTGKSYNGQRYSTFAYDDEGRGVRTEHAGGVERYTFEYLVESTAEVFPPPLPPPPGGYVSDEEDRGWCDYRSGSGRVCYQPMMTSEPVQQSRASSASAPLEASVTKTIPTKLRVTETNPLGRKTTHHYEGDRKVHMEGLLSPNCPYAASAISYDEFGYEDVVTSFDGTKINYNYDPHGYLLSEREAVDTPWERVTSYEWDISKTLLKKVVVPGDHESSYEHDSDGRLMSVTVKNLKPVGVTGQTRTTNYRYTKHDNGLLRTMVEDGPLAGDDVTYTYSQQGDLQQISNALGHVTTFGSYDEMGRPGTVIGPNGARSEFVYDARGRLSSKADVVNGVPQVTSYAYNSFGGIESIRTPTGHVRRFVYDAAHRLVEEYEQEADGTYSRKRTTFNAMSLPTQVQVLKSNYPPNTTVLGNIDSVKKVASGAYEIHGWACTSGQNAPIDVHLYANGPAGSGAFVGNYTANQSSETAIATACAAQGAAYRFVIPLAESVHDQYGGKGIFVHGISPSGNDNRLIAGSGNFTIPVLPPKEAPSGLSGPDRVGNGEYSLTWNATPRAEYYIVAESENGGPWYSMVITGTQANFWNKLAGTYVYKVTACNWTGGCGPESIAITVVELDPPAAPWIGITPAISSDGSYTVSWSGSPWSDYELQREWPVQGWQPVYSGPNLSFRVDGDSNGIKNYRVRACNVAGCGNYSSASVQVAWPAPPIPTGLVVYYTRPSTTRTSYSAHWNASPGAVRYKLSGPISYDGPNRFSFGMVSGAPTGRFKVSACTEHACSAWSAEVMAIPQ